MARVLSEESQYAKTNVGTPYYMSPEQVQEQHYDEKSDIWSLGCLLYEIIEFRPPFHSKNLINLANLIRSGKFERISMNYSYELQSVIASMLELDPKKRPSTQDLIKIPKVE